MAAEILRDPDFEWLDMLQPTGLVVGRNLLRELGLVPERQTQVQSAEAAAHIEEDTDKPALKDPWAFAAHVLGWEARHVAGPPGGPPIPDALTVRLREHDTTLAPTWAVSELGQSERPWQLLVRIEAGIDPDQRGSLAGWEATAHQRFERLLRETGVFAGLMIADKELRLVYAPRGETSGWLSFPIRALATVAGRPVLGGLKLLLDTVRLFVDADERRLPALLKKSRDAQAAVSTALAEQVLGALHEMLRGLDAADSPRIRALAKERPGHLYEGLLTVLMRLVFILYAEDRDLLPSRTDERARQLYESGYSVRGLFGKLTEDAALNPDTMDERRGAWGRLLALFHLIHKGHRTRFVQARGGKLFDPDAFPFLEGRDGLGDPPRVLPVSDGTVLRILEGLMTLKGPNGRERLSYRSLDVEQIGSVYEIVMGFTVETAAGRSLAIRAGKNNRTPVFVDLERLLAQKGKDRIKYLKEEADRSQLSATLAKAIEAAKAVADLAAALDSIVDERASPRKHESAPGTPILQPTDERRRTGSHYTPRSLTEPIVRHALEPAFERLGPQATPEQILELKVCDPAMGSGAFLVEACRAIATKLVESWSLHKDRKPAIPPDEDEDLHARRLVAQRCLYGVDKNPLATDLAKLSLWLATLARDHEFTFLDHALKSGDSLVGLTRAQIAAAHWDMSKPGLPLFRQLVKDRIAEAMKGRNEIQAASDDTARAVQEARHRSLEERIKDVRLIGDAVIAAFFAEDKPKARETRRAEVESWLTGSLEFPRDKLATIAATLKQGAHPLPPFHWAIEFPEVFAREMGGFEAIVGNPPFLGGSRISTNLGDAYLAWLLELHEHSHGNGDLVAHFFRRVFTLLGIGGASGLIATNTIGQGDTRSTALQPILASKGAIYRAVRRLKWPGDAAVAVSVIHIMKDRQRPAVLDGVSARRISAYLVEGELNGSPLQLTVNNNKAFAGCKIYGQGYLFDDKDAARGAATPIVEMYRLIEIDRRNAERIFPYLGGDEVNSDPRHKHYRYVIDFFDFPLRRDDSLLSWLRLTTKQREQCLAKGVVPADYPDGVAADWPDLLQIVKGLVKPYRDHQKRAALRERWWQYGEKRPGLRRATAGLARVLVRPLTSAHFSTFVFVENGQIFDQTLVTIATERYGWFSVLASRPHELWVARVGTTLEDRGRYTPSDCFRTFAFPPDLDTLVTLEKAGRTYHDHRAAVMVARNEGMTKTYNRFHEKRPDTPEDIRRLRELHAMMDRAVLEAYGWRDLAARAEPIFLDETNEDDHPYQGRLFWPSDFRDEVLARLLALNAERHAEEVRLAIAPGMKGREPGEESEHDMET
jgi:hypothetical protein